jgi:hypothetical protein
MNLVENNVDTLHERDRTSLSEEHEEKKNHLMGFSFLRVI